MNECVNSPSKFQSQFPSSWPKGCPPRNASPADNEVFRVTKTRPPTEHDFKSHDELGKAPSGPRCLRLGLSLFERHHDAEHLLQLFPKLGNYILRAKLEPKHGVIEATPSNRFPTHITWWPYEGVNRIEPFHSTIET